MSGTKDVKQYLKRLEKIGFTVERTKNHYRIRNVEGRIVSYASSTASYQRAVTKVRCQVRRGFDHDNNQ